MLAKELQEELRLIAYSDMSKPLARIGALSTLIRNGLDSARVRDTLYSIATDIDTPDSVKVRAIDLLDKLDISTAPKELEPDKVHELEKTLMEQYAGTT